MSQPSNNKPHLKRLVLFVLVLILVIATLRYFNAHQHLGAVMDWIAGQGLNAGLRDVGALAQVLAEAARRGEDFAAPDVLERYQQWRRFDTATLAAVTDATNRLFSNDNPVLRLGRDIGMGVLGAMPGLRRGFIREAAGLTGDLPELMKG